jgi:hypothetical protein
MTAEARNRRIAVVLATPPGLNTGMAAVELGLQAFARRHGLTDRLELKRLCSMDERLRQLPPEARDDELRRASTPLPSSLLESVEELDTYGCVLFWGDFLHMAQYVRALGATFPSLNPSLSRATGGQVDRILLLDGAPDALLARTVSFGTTLLFNARSDVLDGDYHPKLVRFARGASRIWVRDVLSAANLAHALKDYSLALWGPDCAQILDRDDLPASPSTAGDTYVFFGRSEELSRPARDLVARLTRDRGRPAFWLPWGSSAAFPHLEAAASFRRSFAPLDPRMTALDVLGRIAGASLVVTDTYHLCVIAWTLGVPAVCVCDPLSPLPSNVNSGKRFNWRDKREVFFSQYDALDYFVRDSELEDRKSREARIAHLQAALRNTSAIDGIRAAIRAHTTSICAQLAAHLGRLLAEAGR